MRTIAPQSLRAVALSDVLFALSDPSRLAIVAQLDRQGDKTCGTFDLPLAKSTLSRHFKVLRDAGIIETTADGVRRVNTLRRDALDGRFPGLLDAVLSAPRPW